MSLFVIAKSHCNLAGADRYRAGENSVTRAPFGDAAGAVRGRNGPNRARELPAVMAVCEPMGKLCEPREGRPPMEFPVIEPLEIEFER